MDAVVDIALEPSADRAIAGGNTREHELAEGVGAHQLQPAGDDGVRHRPAVGKLDAPADARATLEGDIGHGLTIRHCEDVAPFALEAAIRGNRDEVPPALRDTPGGPEAIEVRARHRHHIAQLAGADAPDEDACERVRRGPVSIENSPGHRAGLDGRGAEHDVELQHLAILCESSGEVTRGAVRG